MDKLQIGVNLHKLLQSSISEDVVAFRQKLETMAQEIIAEESKDKVLPELAFCDDCVRHGESDCRILGTGPVPARLMFVYDFIGQGTLVDGVPPSYSIADNILAAARRLDKTKSLLFWRKENIFITHLVKCRMVGGDYDATTINSCYQKLMTEIELVKPEYIVCWGKAAAEALIHPKFDMRNELGLLFASRMGPKVMAFPSLDEIDKLQNTGDKDQEIKVKRQIMAGIKRLNSLLMGHKN